MARLMSRLVDKKRLSSTLNDDTPSSASTKPTRERTPMAATRSSARLVKLNQMGNNQVDNSDNEKSVKVNGKVKQQREDMEASLQSPPDVISPISNDRSPAQLIPSNPVVMQQRRTLVVQALLFVAKPNDVDLDTGPVVREDAMQEQSISTGVLRKDPTAQDGLSATEPTSDKRRSVPYTLPMLTTSGAKVTDTFNLIESDLGSRAVHIGIPLPEKGNVVRGIDVKSAVSSAYRISLSHVNIDTERNASIAGLWLINTDDDGQQTASDYYALRESISDEYVTQFLFAQGPVLPKICYVLKAESWTAAGNKNFQVKFCDNPLHKSMHLGSPPLLNALASDEQRSIRIEALTKELAELKVVHKAAMEELATTKRQLTGIRANFGGKTLTAVQLQERGLRQVRTEKELKTAKAALIANTLDKLQWQNSVLSNGARRDDQKSIVNAGEKIQLAAAARRAAGIYLDEDESDDFKAQQVPEAESSSSAVALGADQDHHIQVDDEVEQGHDDCEYEVDEEVAAVSDRGQASNLLDDYEAENAIVGSSKRTYEEANLEEDDTGLWRYKRPRSDEWMRSSGTDDPFL
ncbi:hypothetical protein LTR05_008465 [Lithohypha guttulata]|uniref:Uncharacterized protein n=1 Tax=Lithohypha guttulata TaxID=1690604 RepID=A0AAN7SET0_9EURO|nr:hypothetical protein LTR05_008465 [Lithohypha guttulata]